MQIEIDFSDKVLRLQTAIDLCQICEQSYAGSTIQDELNHVLIGEYPEKNVVAFRGTANMTDFVTDGSAWLRNDKTQFSGLVHAGFARAFDSIYDPLVKVVTALDHSKPTFFTGHSLGGAQAVLAAYHFYGLIPSNYCFTFGQPRVGNKAFTFYAHQRIPCFWRYCNAEDIVPRIPGLLAGYRHTGSLEFIDSSNRLWSSPSTTYEAISDLIGFYKELRHGQIALLADHHVDAYLSNLQNCFVKKIL